MSLNCSICGVQLDAVDYPETKSCGGDCVKCMAEAGDPEAVRTMIKLYSKAIIELTELIS